MNGASPRNSAASRNFLYNHLRRQKNRCAWCGKLTSFEAGYHNQPSLDHIVPIGKSGPNSMANTRMLCKPCNNERGDTVHLLEVVYVVAAENGVAEQWITMHMKGEGK